MSYKEEVFDNWSPEGIICFLFLSSSSKWTAPLHWNMSQQSFNSTRYLIPMEKSDSMDLNRNKELLG